MSRQLFLAAFLLAIASCADASVPFVWTEPLAATSEGGVLVLTKTVDAAGDVATERCPATRLLHVGPLLEVRSDEVNVESLCDATRIGNVWAAVGDEERIIFADLFDNGKIKLLQARIGVTTFLMNGCVSESPIISVDGDDSRRIAVALPGCSADSATWIHRLQLAPDFGSLLHRDSVQTPVRPRRMSFGPGPMSLLVQVDESAERMLFLVDLTNGSASFLTRGEAPASRPARKDIAFLRSPEDDNSAWTLMLVDSLGGAPHALLSRDVARRLLADTGSTFASAPILSSDGEYVWIGFGGRVLRVRGSTGAVDVVRP